MRHMRYLERLERGSRGRTARLCRERLQEILDFADGQRRALQPARLDGNPSLGLIARHCAGAEGV